MSEAQPSQQQLKQAAAEYAVNTFVKPNMNIGLGSGSTAELFVEELGRRAGKGEFGSLLTVATSEKIAVLARTFGLKVVELDQVPQLDLTVDGADEVDPATFYLTKGRGGALLREKLVASASQTEIIIADESKLVRHLGEKMPIPVEVVPFGWNHTAGRLRTLGGNPVLRLRDEKPYLTDGNNYVLDCQFPVIQDVPGLAAALKNTVGVVEHGIFVGLARKVVIAASGGIHELPVPAGL